MFSTAVVDAAARWLERRTSRRTFLQRVAVVGSAMSVSGLDYVLRPGTAYASVCGSGASCASGWTALCCTIHNGVNQCPPGSFAAGWWKADGASLCGGKARYYIDCQARCTSCGCPSGYHFCASSCWNCSSHCADAGTCDQRRVCHNVFRYGQCHQEIHCSGPVWCRVISCTPPWKWESCSTASATDNNTVTHSAPCVAHSWTPLQERYRNLGSQGSPLGASIGPEHTGVHGTWQEFQHGRMYHGTEAGTHYVLGALAAYYAGLGQSGSPLGLPVTDTQENADGRGRHNLFRYGAIFSSTTTGPHALWGPVWHKWDVERRVYSPMGYPTSDVLANSDRVGHHAYFERGAIFSSPDHGTWMMETDVLTLWRHFHSLTGPLGYPTADLAAVTGTSGARQRFVGGVVDRHPTAGLHAVWGPIFDAWRTRYGAETGQLGFPTSSVHPVDTDHDRCDFEHGSLVLDKTTGQVTLV